MLSYQHAYHAGNIADVHKHAALCCVLDYMVQKDKPLTYVETHAGRGLYDLTAPEAEKTGEAAKGIAKLESVFPGTHPYRQMLEKARSRHGRTAYPGSPLIARTMLRPKDTLHLAELHPQEHRALEELLQGTGAHVYREDGFHLARRLTPPDPRRGLMLIDPSYEVKQDYLALPPFLADMHRKWNVGVLMLWYPILTSGSHQPMIKALEGMDFPGALHHQVSFPPARPGHGMVGSGLFFVNAPFGTAAELDAIAARLAERPGLA